jgi:microcystin-dependent protein
MRADAIGASRPAQPHNNMQFWASTSSFPFLESSPRGTDFIVRGNMAQPFLAQIQIFAFNFPPVGWTLCNEQLLAINQDTASFSLIGTTFGGNG